MEQSPEAKPVGICFPDDLLIVPTARRLAAHTPSGARIPFSIAPMMPSRICFNNEVLDARPSVSFRILIAHGTLKIFVLASFL
jgi:hypothetical protein